MISNPSLRSKERQSYTATCYLIGWHRLRLQCRLVPHATSGLFNAVKRVSVFTYVCKYVRSIKVRFHRKIEIRSPNTRQVPKKMVTLSTLGPGTHILGSYMWNVVVCEEELGSSAKATCCRIITPAATFVVETVDVSSKM
jgi:hypothetical protein